MSDEMSPFADFLDQRREDITAEWLRRVRRDRKIPSAADLPKEELLDHLPYLLDTLIKQLRGTLVDGGGQSHGAVRWKQHYCLDEVLREISILRKVLIEELLRFHCDTKVELKLQVQASDILHACLDLIISSSTAGFVARQYEKIQAANRSLEELNLRVESVNDQLLEKDRQRLQMLRTITHEIANHRFAGGKFSHHFFSFAIATCCHPMFVCRTLQLEVRDGQFCRARNHRSFQIRTTGCPRSDRPIDRAYAEILVAGGGIWSAPGWSAERDDPLFSCLRHPDRK